MGGVTLGLVAVAALAMLQPAAATAAAEKSTQLAVNTDTRAHVKGRQLYVDGELFEVSLPQLLPSAAISAELCSSRANRTCRSDRRPHSTRLFAACLSPLDANHLLLNGRLSLRSRCAASATRQCRSTSLSTSPRTVCDPRTDGLRARPSCGAPATTESHETCHSRLATADLPQQLTTAADHSGWPQRLTTANCHSREPKPCATVDWHSGSPQWLTTAACHIE